jgi:hypothetical protein
MPPRCKCMCAFYSRLSIKIALGRQPANESAQRGKARSRQRHLRQHGIDLVVILHACALCYTNHIRRTMREHAPNSSGVASARIMLPSNMNLRAMRSGRCRNPATNKLCVVQPDEKNYASLPKILKIIPNSASVQRLTLAK